MGFFGQKWGFSEGWGHLKFNDITLFSLHTPQVMYEYQRKNCEQTADGIFQLEKSNRKSKNRKFFDFTAV